MKNNKVSIVLLTMMLAVTTILNVSSVFAEKKSVLQDIPNTKTEREISTTRFEYGDFEYEEVNGAIKITKYKGDALVIVIPEEIDGKKITIIGESAFSSSPDKWLQVKRVVMPDTVIRIERYAFVQNQYLEEVKLSSSLEAIGEGAFMGTSLSSIEFPKKLTYIENNAFVFCKFTSIDLPNSISIDKSTDNFFQRVFHTQRGPSIYAVKDNNGWYVDLKNIDEKIKPARIKTVRSTTVSSMGNTYHDLSNIGGIYTEDTGIIRFTSDPTGKSIDYEYQVQMSEAGEKNLMNVTVKIETVRNEHMVNFDKENVAGLKVIVGNKYKNLPNLTRRGYDALWNTRKDGTGLDITKEIIVTVDAPHTLYPKYIAKSYQVTFQANEGTFTSKESMIKKVTFDQVYGQLPEVEREGFECIGWNTQRDGSGDYVVKDTKMNRDEDHELYAIYKKTTIQQPEDPEEPDNSVNPDNSISNDSVNTGDYTNWTIYTLIASMALSSLVMLSREMKKRG